MFRKFKIVEYCLIFLLLFCFASSAIIFSEDVASDSKCQKTEDENVSYNSTYESAAEMGKYVGIRGKTSKHFRSLIADIVPKKSKTYWVPDAVERKTSEAEASGMDLSTISLRDDDMKIVATTMLDESNVPTKAPFHTESSSVSSQLNKVSNSEEPVEDLNITFQARKDDAVVNVDGKFENKTSIVTMDASAEDIPSFREWAEKHLAAEEKERGDENNTNVIGSTNVPKMRNKNYASPDCGAKLLNTNPEAKAAGSFLSSSRDEYLLSPCNTKIWFVVELCEAVQLKKIELANFELFSSSPRDFSVSISDRFPSRDWSIVGQFTAKDEKSIQSFNLKPRHFTKYIKVEFQSHYGREHFCPISLFRVYGTSEFEVLETVDSNDVLGDGNVGNDEFDQNSINDEDVIEPIMGEFGKDSARGSETSNNLFGSARDVVIHIVKKAAEALSNVPHQNRSDQDVAILPSKSADGVQHKFNFRACITPKYAISCAHCQQPLFHKVYELVSCHLKELEHMLRSTIVRVSIVRSEVCLAASSNRSGNEYIVQLLADEMVVALCHLLSIEVGSPELNVTATIASSSGHATLYPSLERSVPANVSVSGFADESLAMAAFSQPAANVVGAGSVTAVPSSGGRVDAGVPAYSSAAKFEKRSRATATPASFSTTDPFELTQLPVDERSQPADCSDGDSVNARIKPTKTIAIESQLPVRVDASVPAAGVDSPQSVVHNVDQYRAKAIVRTEDDETNGKDGGTSVDAAHGTAEIPDDGAGIDSLIKEWEKSEGVQPVQSSAAAQTKPTPQKESVFVRLANRIKTLERNMSLSGQYLEELSRRYKKQVEDMQRVLSEAADDRQKSVLREMKLSEKVASLNRQVGELVAAVDSLVAERESWGYKALMVGEHSLILFLEVAIFIFIVCVCRGIPNVEISKRKFSLEWNRGRGSRDDAKNASGSVALKRRQSFDDLNANAKPDPKRRPSVEALKIDGATHQDLLIYETHRSSKTGRKRRKRKELLLKSNANAINLETGGDTLLKKRPNTNALNAPLSRSASASEIDDHSWARIDYSGGGIGVLGGTGGGAARRYAAHSVNGNGGVGEFSENAEAVDENAWPSYVQTAASARTKRISISNKFNGKSVLSPVYDVSTDPDSSAPSTPVKEKKVNGFKKMVKKFF